MKLLLLVLAALGLSQSHCSSLPSVARVSGHASATTSCTTTYFGRVAPRLVNAKLAARTTPVCYAGYSVLFSGVTRTPLWSAEKLTAAAIDGAHSLDRVDEFHPDEHLAEDDRSELRDYRRSGFDRGHMSPSGDMGTADAQAQSFSLANIVPQAPGLNRGMWSAIETDVRYMATQSGAVFIVTGPLFEGDSLATVGGRVIVPTSVFKAIYIHGRGAAAYVATNSNPSTLERVSIAELRSRSGIDVFPAVSESAKQSAMALPMPRVRRHRAARTEGAQT